MTNILPAEPGDTNPTARLKSMIRTDHGQMSVWTADEARVAIDAHRAEVLSEVADMLMAADETAAALLVDRLRDGGQR